MAKFNFDADRCIKCHACEVACETWHDVQLGEGFRVVEEAIEGSFPLVRRQFISRALPGCDLCQLSGGIPRCSLACPSHALRFE